MLPLFCISILTPFQSGLRRVFDLAITAAMINKGFYKTKKSRFLDIVDFVGKLIK